jgi:aldehyde:ferredoxin oxidoreductase
MFTCTGKAGMVAWHDDLYAVADCLGVCKFVTHGFNSPHLLGYEHSAGLVRAFDGLEFTAAQLRAIGGRVGDVQQALNQALGRTRADDTLPKRCFDDPLPGRAPPGHRIERDRFEQMLDEYDAARGWSAAGELPAWRQQELAELARAL